MFNKFQILIKILLEIYRKVLKQTSVDSRAHASRSHLAFGWSQAPWIKFGSSHLGDEDRREDLYLGLFLFV